MPPPIAIVLGYGAAIGALVAGWQLDLDPLRLAAKPVPVLVLALWVWRAAPPGPARAPLAAGLVACALGDAILEAGRFLPALAVFGLGHAGYLAAFLRESRAPRLARAAPFALWGALAFAALAGRLGDLAGPVALYTALICAMMWRASALVGAERPWASAVALGAVLFGASDTLIAVSRFGAPFTGARPAIMALYFAGQLAIACGAVASGARARGAPRGEGGGAAGPARSRGEALA